MYRRLILLLAASISVAAAADVRTVEEIVAKANNDIITRGELAHARLEIEAELRQMGLSGPKLQQALQEKAADALRDQIDQLLLVQKAKDLNINVDSEITKRLAAMQVQSKISDPDKFHDFIREQMGIPFEDYKQQAKKALLTQRVIGEEVSQRRHRTGAGIPPRPGTPRRPPLRPPIPRGRRSGRRGSRPRARRLAPVRRRGRAAGILAHRARPRIPPGAAPRPQHLAPRPCHRVHQTPGRRGPPPGCRRRARRARTVPGEACSVNGSDRLGVRSLEVMRGTFLRRRSSDRQWTATGPHGSGLPDGRIWGVFFLPSRTHPLRWIPGDCCLRPP